MIDKITIYFKELKREILMLIKEIKDKGISGIICDILDGFTKRIKK